MNRRIIPLILFILIIFACTKGQYSPPVEGTFTAIREDMNGCASCHGELSKTLPEGHLPATREGVKHCLSCHVDEGSATAFDWIVHFKHYSREEFPGDCWSCHLIDQEGDFRPYGIQAGGIKVSREDVDRLTPYYHLWGTSEHLDHGHALKGLTCKGCHDVMISEETVPTERCLQCHETYEKLAEKSNIHYGCLYPHFSDKELECSACHRAHDKSVYICNRCHSYDIETP